uniref:G_PROTEIN_RECEP_F1_2 domain-containing protein n=1 Tax=Heterorhabditis bacteriophora TaxID=37862 RepID=A0A1I7WBQ7_HETBA
MRTRDVTEICEVDTVLGMDAEDDTPIIFDLARAWPRDHRYLGNNAFHRAMLIMESSSPSGGSGREVLYIHSRAVFLITSSWILGTAVAILPLLNVFGFAGTEPSFHEVEDECHFTKVVDYRYLIYVIFVGTILAPTGLIVFCYVSIYSRIRKEELQVRSLWYTVTF